jgi:hypothetical protein
LCSYVTTIHIDQWWKTTLYEYNSLWSQQAP